MLLLCCNLLYLADGGSTTVVAGGVHLLHCGHCCVIIRHTYATVTAEGTPRRSESETTAAVHGNRTTPSSTTQTLPTSRSPRPCQCAHLAGSGVPAAASHGVPSDVATRHSHARLGSQTRRRRTRHHRRTAAPADHVLRATTAAVVAATATTPSTSVTSATSASPATSASTTAVSRERGRARLARRASASCLVR